MSDTPMTISVYIPSYNQVEYLDLAIKSVLNQTRLPDQLILIDDASTDGSADLIRSYTQAHPGLVHSILNETNQGIGAARKQAISQSTGDLITYLDGDDLYHPNKLELEEQALIKNPNAGYAYSNFSFIDEHGDKHGEWSTPDAMPSGDLFERIACFDFPRNILYRCELVRREVMLQADSYEQGLNLYEDYDAKLRIARNHTGVAVHETTHAYRRHEQGLHRVSYTKHHDTLNHIYTKNANLLDGLDSEKRRRIEQSINRVLSKHAWRAVKQHANGQAGPETLGVLHYARAGMSRRPSSAINPKHALRVLRALTRG